jgi:hypothetical protein
MAAVQNPAHERCFGSRIQTAAWKKKPAFSLVTENALIIQPTAQHKFARQMKATVQSVSSRHVPMVSQPDATAAFIAEAANKSD